MNAARGFGIVVASGLGFAAGGAGLGYMLGRIAPAYYRGVFRGGEAPDFNPVQVGLGLGITQGLIVGLVVGAVIVLAVAISEARGPRKVATDALSE